MAPTHREHCKRRGQRCDAPLDPTPERQKTYLGRNGLSAIKTTLFGKRGCSLGEMRRRRAPFVSNACTHRLGSPQRRQEGRCSSHFLLRMRQPQQPVNVLVLDLCRSRACLFIFKNDDRLHSEHSVITAQSHGTYLISMASQQRRLGFHLQTLYDNRFICLSDSINGKGTLQPARELASRLPHLEFKVRLELGIQAASAMICTSHVFSIIVNSSALRTESLGDSDTLFLGQYHSTKLLVHLLVVPEQTRVLVYYFKRLSERRPCLSRRRMAMAGCVDVSGPPSWNIGLVMPFLRCRPRYVNINIRIDPERIRLDRVSEGDMAGSSFCETFARENSESTCHMLEHPSALPVSIFDGWNSLERVINNYGRGSRHTPCRTISLFQEADAVSHGDPLYLVLGKQQALPEWVSRNRQPTALRAKLDLGATRRLTFLE
ncbi:hypothetical protein KCU77_g27, partial [Aureobasidium melanogenum]